VDGVAEAITNKVDGENEDDNQDGRGRPLPRLLAEDADRAGIVEEVAPAGRGRLHPQAEVAQRRLQKDVRGHRDARVHEQRRDRVRKNVAQEDRAILDSQDPRRNDEVGLAQLPDLAADAPRRAWASGSDEGEWVGGRGAGPRPVLSAGFGEAGAGRTTRMAITTTPTIARR